MTDVFEFKISGDKRVEQNSGCEQNKEKDGDNGSLSAFHQIGTSQARAKHAANESKNAECESGNQTVITGCGKRHKNQISKIKYQISKIKDKYPRKILIAISSR